MKPIGNISSITGSGLIINGTVNETFWSVLKQDDELVINNTTTEVNSPNNDIQFSVKTSVSASSGDVVYAVSACVWYRVQIWKIDSYISNYNLGLFGVETVKGSFDEVKFNNQNTVISELLTLKNHYQSKLDECEAISNDGDSIWTFRRMETGTF